MKNFQFAVPTALAIIGIVIMARATGIGAPFAAEGYTVASSPTPYSAAHALVQSRPGAPEEQPPTF